MNDIDWMALLKFFTAKNIAKYIVVIFFGLFMGATFIYYVTVLWGRS